MCFVLCLKSTPWGRLNDVTMAASLWDAIRTSFERLFKIYETLDKLSCFCFLVVSQNYTLKIL